MLLTFASVLIEGSNPASVVDERAVIEEKGGGSIRESPVIQVIKSAVVLSAIRRSQVQIRPAEKLCLNLTGSLAGCRTVRLTNILIINFQSQCAVSPSAPCLCRSGR